MIPPLNTNWNVLYTAPRAEKQVKERIAALGVEFTFTPDSACVVRPCENS